MSTIDDSTDSNGGVPISGSDVPKPMWREFYAMAQGKGDYTIPVICIQSAKFGPMMTIMATEEAVYITREQAMDFFGLIAPPESSPTGVCASVNRTTSN